MTAEAESAPAPAAILTEILGVVTEDVWARAAQELAERTGTNVRSLLAAFEAHRPAFERAGEDLEAFYREVALATDLSIGLEAFSEVLLDRALELVPQNWQCFQDLRASQVRVCAVSNIPGPVYEALEAKFDLSSLFDDVTLSFREQMAKPNAQVYIQAIERAGVPPGSILYVDASTEHLAGAGEWGLRCLRVERPADLVPAIGPIFGLDQ